MSRMSEAHYELIQDCKEKKITARSARNTRTHCGKGGSVKFPSDYLSAKEKKKLSGECKSYRMNDPMTWEEFKALPDDLKVCYVKALRQKYGVSDSALADMLGISHPVLSRVFTDLGLNKGNGVGKRVWDKEGFMAWRNGESVQVKVDDVVPTEEENAEIVNEVENDDVWAADHLAPRAGRMTFVGHADDISKTIKNILKNGNVRLTVEWYTVDETGVVNMDSNALAKAATTINYAMLNEQRKNALNTKG